MGKRRIKKEQRIENQVQFGLDSIDESLTVEVNLRQMLLVYKTIQELRRFFHNQDHYQTIEDVHTYMGTQRSGMYSVLNRIYCKEFETMLPKEVISLAESDQLPNPDYPYYVTMSDLR